MKQYIEITCRYCGTDDLAKNGAQRYRRGGYGRSFRHEYTYNAWKPGVKERIETRTLNSSGIGDIGGNLGISPNTAVSELNLKYCTIRFPVFCKIHMRKTASVHILFCFSYSNELHIPRRRRSSLDREEGPR